MESQVLGMHSGQLPLIGCEERLSVSCTRCRRDKSRTRAPYSPRREARPVFRRLVFGTPRPRPGPNQSAPAGPCSRSSGSTLQHSVRCHSGVRNRCLVRSVSRHSRRVRHSRVSRRNHDPMCVRSSHATRRSSGHTRRDRNFGYNSDADNIPNGSLGPSGPARVSLPFGPPRPAVLRRPTEPEPQQQIRQRPRPRRSQTSKLSSRFNLPGLSLDGSVAQLKSLAHTDGYFPEFLTSASCL